MRSSLKFQTLEGKSLIRSEPAPLVFCNKLRDITVSPQIQHWSLGSELSHEIACDGKVKPCGDGDHDSVWRLVLSCPPQGGPVLTLLTP